MHINDKMEISVMIKEQIIYCVKQNLHANLFVLIECINDKIETSIMIMKYLLREAEVFDPLNA